jgi:competence ComEA-like helix-hairpin-helix protein
MSEKSWDKDWLVFSRKARRGVFVLLFIFVIVAVIPRIYRNHFMNSPLDVQISKLSAQKREEDKRIARAKKKKTKTDKFEKKKSFSYKIPVSPFNPNTYSFEEWKSIGFSEKQVKTILKYRQNGGVFRVKEDVKKLYVIDDKLYAQLKEMIDLPESDLSREPKVAKDKVEALWEVKLNINRATEEELKSISGIGPFFAKQIVRLRDSYGGIHDLNQLLEIYRMDEEKLSKIKSSLFIEVSDITKLNINTATREELSNHEEISWNMANSIVTLRETHGEYSQLDDLLKSILIDREKLEKIKPYLRIE